jgi:hypothetical protein
MKVQPDIALQLSGLCVLAITILSFIVMWLNSRLYESRYEWMWDQYETRERLREIERAMAAASRKDR